MTPSIKHFYSELLINVRIISIFLLVDDASDKAITVSLGHDRSSAALRYGEQEVTVQLPARVSLDHAASFTINVSDTNEATARLPLNESWTRSSDVDGTAGPWSAADLRDVECAHCVECKRNIVKPGVISAWKDLPSENWAEMMDFWHCHKPEVPDTDGTDGSINKKGYSASNKLSAQAGTALVDVSHLLVKEESCTNITVVNAEPVSHPHAPQRLQCSACDAIIGFVDSDTDGWRLYKWALALGFLKQVQLQQLNFEKCMSARLLSLSEAQSMRQVPLRSYSSPESGIMIWIFTPEIWLTYLDNRRHTEESSPSPTRAMKVMWRPILDDAHERIDSSDALVIPDQMCRPIYDLLHVNAARLPTSSGASKDWYMSYLERY